MRKINKFVFLLFLSSLINFTFATQYHADTILTISTCGNYEYVFSAPVGFYGVTDMQVWLCYGGNNITPRVVSGGDGESLRINNLNSVQYSITGFGWNTWGIPSGCSNSSCTFSLVDAGAHTGTIPTTNICSDWSNTSIDYYVSDVITTTPYLGCVPPSLSFYNSTLLSDRYRFQFNISGASGYDNVQCTLNLQGQINNLGSAYQITFSQNSTIDVLYTDFPKGFTTANVRCVYSYMGAGTGGHEQGVYYSNVVFANENWLVDTAIPYGIKNLFYTPSRLYSYQTLRYIEFDVRSTFDNTPYPSAIRANLSSTTDITALNCSGSVNITRDLANTNQYELSPMVTCNNSASIAFILSAYDQQSLQSLGSYNFNVTWDEGNMVIDNVNLIKRISTGDLELWATISNDYTKAPIPLASNLTCNYSITSYDTGENFNGSMGEMPTWQHLPNAYFTLAQSDMINTTFDPATSYNLSNKFQVFINCSANNYADAQIGTDRWIGNRRLVTFKCLEYDFSTSLPYLGLAFFSDRYNTNQVFIQCTIIPDLALEAGTNSQEQGVITRLLSDFVGGQTSTVISTNINANIYSACKDLVGGATSSSSNPYQQTITYTTTLHERDQNCYNFIALQEGKNSNDIVNFAMFTTGSNNIITNSTITPTTADITFDLEYLPLAKVLNTSLVFANNKTAHANIIENNDMMICITAIQDPSSLVALVQHQYYDVNNPSNSCTTKDAIRSLGGNNSNIYASWQEVNSTSCPFFGLSNVSGYLVCKSVISQIGGLKTEQVSNQVLFITPTTRSRTDINTQLMSDAGGALNWAVNWALSNPLGFLLLILLFVVFIIAMMIYLKIYDVLLRLMGYGNDEGD